MDSWNKGVKLGFWDYMFRFTNDYIRGSISEVVGMCSKDSLYLVNTKKGLWLARLTLYMQVEFCWVYLNTDFFFLNSMCDILIVTTFCIISTGESLFHWIYRKMNVQTRHNCVFRLYFERNYFILPFFLSLLLLIAHAFERYQSFVGKCSIYWRWQLH